MDNVPSLNEDVVGSIADFLSFKEILHASHVCRSWFMMFGSKRVFRRYFLYCRMMFLNHQSRQKLLQTRLDHEKPKKLLFLGDK